MSNVSVLRRPAAKAIFVGLLVVGIVMVGGGLLTPGPTCKNTCADSPGNNYPVAIVGAVLLFAALFGLLSRHRHR